MVWAAAGVGAVILAAFLLVEVWIPGLRLRRILRRLAKKDFRPVIVPASGLFFRNSTRDVRTIAELLQQLDRQITDEGFSLRAILSSMVEGVLIADRSHRIRLVNDALVQLFALGEPPVNRTVIEVFRKHDLQETLEAVMESGRPQRIELAFETAGPGGYEVKHFDVHVAGLNPKPNAPPSAALVVFHDVTRIHDLEAMRREFLANVSHEFRTPLAIINGYLETLLDGALEDREMTVHSIRTMHKNVRRLSLLIDDLLTISRIEHRATLLEFQTGDLRETLDRVLEHLEPNLSERGASVEIDWPEDARRAEIDAQRIEQVFSNLLGNALRYGDATNLVIRISARRQAGEIEMVFQDNGPGIPYEDQPHIFERFYRVHKGRSRDAGGTGLGLSIVRSIVEGHGGTVHVESTPGAGASFHVRLPAWQSGQV